MVFEHQRTDMMRSKEARGADLLHQRSPTSKESLFPRTSSSHKLQDKVTALRSGKPAEKIFVDQSTAAKVQAKTPKVVVRTERPYKEGNGVEELVKYMSKVPAYLQLLENKGDTTTNQEKALNIGVLDWGNLQNWTDRHKLVAGRKDTYSPSGGLVRLASQNDSISSGQMKRCPSPTSSRNRLLPSKEEAKNEQSNDSKMFASFLNLDTAALGISIGLPHLKAVPPIVCDEVEREARNASLAASRSMVAGNQCKSQEIDTFRSPIIGRGMSRLPELKDSDAGSEFNIGKFVETDHGRKKCPDRACRKLELPQSCSSGTLPSADGLQGSEHFSIVNRRSSVESNGCHELPVTSPCDKFSESFLLEDLHYVSRGSGIPHSCPLPCSAEVSELMDSGIELFKFSQDKAYGLSYTPVRAHVMDTPVHTDPKNIRMRGSLEESHNTRAMLPTLSKDQAPNRVFKVATEAVTPCTQRTQSCHSPYTRSSSLKVISDVKQVRLDGRLDTSSGDKGRSNSRGRRSPLRRLLDPILKPRASEHCCGEVTESPMTIVRRLSFADKSSSHVQKHVRRCLNPSPEARLNSTADQSRSKLRPPPNNNDAASQIENKSSRRQALVRLAWKNELPLLTFSMNDTDILVATRKRTFAAKTDIKSCYTFYYVNELKKKTGGWINQGNKKQDLVSKVVGKMYVSSRHTSSSPAGDDSVTDVGSMNFVLVGPELRPTASGNSQILPDSELAAVIVQSSKGASRSSSVNHSSSDSNERGSSLLTQSSTDECSSSAAETCSSDSDRSRFKVAAILPSEVHGLSNSGAPSSLIDRWKSGGSCDCGGWDVGCSLTVLAEDIDGSSKSITEQTHPSTDGSRRADLFIQGSGVKESRPSFSLVMFKEGLYTVEFDSSIAALQSFALCISLLHCQRLSSHHRVQNFPSQLLPSESIVSKNAQDEEVPASYMPNHPPLSPVGRA